MTSAWRLLLVTGLCLTFVFPWTGYTVPARAYDYPAGLNPASVDAVQARRGNVARYAFAPTFVGEAIEGKEIDVAANLMQALAIVVVFGMGWYVSLAKPQGPRREQHV